MAKTQAPFSLVINGKQSPVFKVPPAVENLSVNTTDGAVTVQIGDLDQYYAERIKEGKSNQQILIISDGAGTANERGKAITVNLLGEDDNFGYSNGIPIKSKVIEQKYGVLIIIPVGYGRWTAIAN